MSQAGKDAIDGKSRIAAREGVARLVPDQTQDVSKQD